MLKPANSNHNFSKIFPMLCSLRILLSISWNVVSTWNYLGYRPMLHTKSEKQWFRMSFIEHVLKSANDMRFLFLPAELLMTVSLCFLALAFYIVVYYNWNYIPRKHKLSSCAHSRCSKCMVFIWNAIKQPLILLSLEIWVFGYTFTGKGLTISQPTEALTAQCLQTYMIYIIC